MPGRSANAAHVARVRRYLSPTDLRGDRRARRWAVAALAAFVPLLYVTPLLSDATFTWLIREEHPIELLGAISLLAAGVICLVLWRRVAGDPAWPPLRRLSLLVLALLFVFATGEEVSWGQRIFAIETPDALSESNRQGELNLHNVNALGGVNALFQLFWLIFGVVIPVVAMWRPDRLLLERLTPILPVALAPLFVLNQLLTPRLRRAVDAQSRALQLDDVSGLPWHRRDQGDGRMRSPGGRPLAHTPGSTAAGSRGGAGVANRPNPAAPRSAAIGTPNRRHPSRKPPPPARWIDTNTTGRAPASRAGTPRPASRSVSAVSAST